MQPIYNHKEVMSPPSSTSYDKKLSNKASNSNGNNGKRRRVSLLILIAIIFLIWASSLWVEQQEVLSHKNGELKEIKAKVKEANSIQADLSYQVKRLHDKDYIAEIARRDYFLSRPGEMIFQVPKK